MEEGYEYEPVSTQPLKAGEEHPGFKRRRIGTKSWDYCCGHGDLKSRCRECCGSGVARRGSRGGRDVGGGEKECEEKDGAGALPVLALSVGNISITKDNAKVGMAVEARYDRGQTLKFYPGVISRIYKDGTFGITFADGDVEKGVRSEWIR